jgi:hypothetical protein
MTHVFHRLARENVAHQVLDPLLISLGRGRMPPVQTIELQQQGLSQVTGGVKRYFPRRCKHCRGHVR